MDDYTINTLFMVLSNAIFPLMAINMIQIRKKWLYVLLLSVGAVLIRLGLHYLGLGEINGIIQLSIIPLFTMLMANEKPLRSAFASFIIILVVFMCEIPGEMIFRAFGFDLVSDYTFPVSSNPAKYVFVRLVTLAISAVIAYLAVLAWNRVVKKSGDSTLISFMLFPLSQALLCWFGGEQVVSLGGQEKDYALLSLLMLLCVVADWLMLKAMKRLRAADEEKHKAIFLEQQVRQQKSYYMHVRQEAEETSRVRHDMRNAIQTAYSLFNSGQTVSGGKILEGLTDRISSAQFFCSNAVVNAVVNEKADACREAGIEFCSHLDVGEDLGISEMDLCSLFANILDNAVNGCADSGLETQKMGRC